VSDDRMLCVRRGQCWLCVLARSSACFVLAGFRSPRVCSWFALPIELLQMISVLVDVLWVVWLVRELCLLGRLLE